MFPGCTTSRSDWVPGSDVPVDHYRVILTEHPIVVTPGREHWSEVRNVSGWLSWSVHPGEGLWVTVTAVGADGERSYPASSVSNPSPADGAPRRGQLASRQTGPAAPA